MRRDYEVKQRPSDRLRVIDGPEGIQVWSAAPMRKAAGYCCVCKLGLVKGEVAWRPITNKANRADRAHGECFA